MKLLLLLGNGCWYLSRWSERPSRRPVRGRGLVTSQPTSSTRPMPDGLQATDVNDGW